MRCGDNTWSEPITLCGLLFISKFKLLCPLENCDLLSCTETEPFLRPNADDAMLLFSYCAFIV